MPVTVLSMLIAVIVVGIGLLIVGFGTSGWRTLLLGGLIIGLGVASMHYIGMAAMRMPDTVRYNNGLVVLSVVIAVVAGTAALWAALRLATVWLDPHRVADHGRGGERDALHRHRGHARLRHPGPRHAGRDVRGRERGRRSCCRSSSASASWPSS